ncbi:NADP-dependent oxidoreductase [Rhodococcoides kyotonense]|uniref:NADPH:quinone reductase n=1 Tax=Rhodococcoides kyotonense TaxID=398843 RepID=A0A239L4B7_9NOCA|nr:NADP-dependent oxidoreductase [Rhodococcus kyotonensis]SNT24842.1 NADPH:quinone reductase [Rhodococcus kyotonensis]
MRAVYFERHGGPEVLRYGELPLPEPKPRQILIEVHAAGVNPRDWQLRDGSYAFKRLAGRPPTILGSDVSGVVVGHGRSVSAFQIGDEVLAMQSTFGRMGGFSEYMAVDERAAALKPRSLTHVAAAALPVCGLTAWQALHDYAEIRSGTPITVIGASGGVGHYAIQIARDAGAVVTGICGPHSLDMVRALGVDRLVNYARSDYTREIRGQSIVFDTVGRESARSCRSMLAPDGVYLTTDPTLRSAARSLLTPLRRHLWGGRLSRLVLVRPRSEDLEAIVESVNTGALRPVVEDVFPLADAGTALARSSGHHTRGKLVIEVR